MPGRTLGWYAAVIVLVLACSSSGGSSDPPSDQELVDLDTTFELAVGEVAGIESTGLTVEFERVVSDSRCPTGATCVWEGDAAVAVAVRLDGSSASYELHTQRREATELEFEGFVVRLVDLVPLPDLSNAPKPDSYTASLIASRR